MSDDLRRLAANLLGTAVVIGAALLVVLGLKNIQVAVNGPIYTPTRKIAAVVESTVQPAPTEVGVTPSAVSRSTPTPIPRGNIRPGAGIEVQPAPYPYSDEVDLAGDVPDTEKHVVIIRHFDGTQIRYILAKTMLTEFSNFIIMAPDDEMVASYPLLSSTPTATSRDMSAAELPILLPTQGPNKAIATPVPLPVIDLAGYMPASEKHAVIIRSPNGRRMQYLVPDTMLSQLADLVGMGSEDVIEATYPLVDSSSAVEGEDLTGQLPSQEIYIQRVVDRAEGLADEAVYAYVVRSRRGFYVQYLVPKEAVRTTELRRLLDLSAGDQIVDAYSLVGLPQRPRVSTDLSVALVAAETHCTKFDLALCDRMTTLRQDEQVDVAIWLRDIDYNLAYDIIAAPYPTIQPRRHQPFDPTHPEFANAMVELETLLGYGYRQRAKALLFLLNQLGIDNAEVSPWAPVVTATLSPEALLALTGADEVLNVHLLPDGR